MGSKAVATARPNRFPRKSRDTAPRNVFQRSLAVCLTGLSHTMIETEWEEEVRKQAVMRVSFETRGDRYHRLTAV